MKILVTGANGMLGQDLCPILEDEGHTVVETDVDTLDITNFEMVKEVLNKEKPDCVIHCAAYTNVDKAEEDLETAKLINSKGTENIAKVSSELDITVVYISTDYVFQGDRSIPCREDWPTEPLGVYGVTKLQGEKAVLASGCKFLIFRTAWLYSPYGKNFVKTMRSLTAEKDSLSVVFDQVGTPTYAKDLATLIFKVIQERMLDKTGIYHFSDEGVCSWYDFACAIRDLSGNFCDIRPCHSDEFPSKTRRPHFSVLDKTLVKNTFGITVPHWYESLKDCISRL